MNADKLLDVLVAVGAGREDRVVDDDSVDFAVGIRDKDGVLELFFSDGPKIETKPAAESQYEIDQYLSLKNMLLVRFDPRDDLLPPV